MTTAWPILLFAAFTTWQEVVPYKPSNEFEVIIDYKFQERPPIDHSKEYQATPDEKNRKTGPLPYLKLQLKFLKLSSDEVKVKVVNSGGNTMYHRKATEGPVITLDIGFSDDVKDRITPYEFTAVLYSDTKKSTSRIHLVIMEDGAFMVNDVKKGKF